MAGRYTGSYLAAEVATIPISVDRNKVASRGLPNALRCVQASGPGNARSAESLSRSSNRQARNPQPKKPETMTVDHKHESVVANAVAALLGCVQQAVDLVRIEVVFRPFMGVCRITLYLTPLGRCHSASNFSDECLSEYSTLLTEYALCNECGRLTR